MGLRRLPLLTLAALALAACAATPGQERALRALADGLLEASRDMQMAAPRPVACLNPGGGVLACY